MRPKQFCLLQLCGQPESNKRLENISGTPELLLDVFFFFFSFKIVVALSHAINDKLRFKIFINHISFFLKNEYETNF